MNPLTWIRLSKFLFFGSLLLVFACEPASLPEPKDDGPVYFGEMEIDGEKVFLGSGEDRVYNFSFYENGPLSSIRMSSVLQKDTCTYPCPNSFRIDLYGRENWSGGGLDPFSQLRPGNIIWFNPKEISKRWNVNAFLSYEEPKVLDPTIRWSYNGDMLNVDEEEIKDLVIDSSDNFDLCVFLKSASFHRQMICYHMETSAVQPMLVSLSGSKTGGQMVDLRANVKFGRPPYKFFWNGVEGNNEQRIRMVSDTSTVRLRVVDRLGNMVTMSNVASLADSLLFSINSTLNLEVEREFQVANVKGAGAIRWVDASGIEYSSDLKIQDQGAHFEVEDFSLENSQDPSEGIMKVRLNFEADLFNRNGDQKNLRNGKARMVFRYPK